MKENEKDAITLRINSDVALENKGKWIHRFEIKSESSDRKYILAFHADKHFFGCSCQGWLRYRKCKHLAALNLPFFEQPCDINVIMENND
jgi:serine protease inhibitor